MDEKEIKEFIDAWNQFLDAAEVAAHLGISRNGVYKRKRIVKDKGYILEDRTTPRFSKWAKKYLDLGCTITRREDDKGPAYVAHDEDGTIVDWWRISP